MSTKPGVVFELSWEVCNMVGGIHTVLMTKAIEMNKAYGDGYITIGPNVPHSITAGPVFREEIWNPAIMNSLQHLGVTCRMGRWLIPGEPRTILVSFRKLLENKDRIFAQYWEKYQLHSLFGGYDYQEPLIFAHAAGLVIEHIFSRHLLPNNITAVVNAHEWMAAAAILHLRDKSPEIGTVFTTHATVVGRSLSSRSRDIPVNQQIKGTNPEELAKQLDVVSKHSIESIATRISDAFTTVSDITGEESLAILGRKPDIILYNGLGDEVPSPTLIQPVIKNQMRNRLFDIAQAATGTHYDPQNTLIFLLSGRYEYINKGVDLFINSLADLRDSGALQGKRILGLIMCPRECGPYQRTNGTPLLSTHEVHPEDPSLKLFSELKITNDPKEALHMVMLPIYLNGNDKKIPENYLDLLTGADLGVFPSHYEPWGYTPHEATALSVPTVTTDLAGFGQWAKPFGLWHESGVFVLPREKSDFKTARAQLCEFYSEFIKMDAAARAQIGGKAHKTSLKARWSGLAQNYVNAHSFALEAVGHRTTSPEYDKLRSFSQGNLAAPSPFSMARAHIRHIDVRPTYPDTLNDLMRLGEKSIWWLWQPKVIRLLSKLSPELWAQVGQDPRLFVEKAGDDVIAKLNSKPEFSSLLKEIRDEYNDLLKKKAEPELAYFCMEYGLTDTLRIYSGGLGMLAGDHLKTASDMKLPLVAFGLFYRFGYFRQRVTSEGVQESHFHRSDSAEFLLEPVKDANGVRVQFQLPLGNRSVHVRAWKVNMGPVDLFLLDTDMDENPADLRFIADRLYNAEPSKRLMQEWVLSMGGLELIRILKMEPKAYHMNEGHTAFLILGRTANLMKKHKLSFSEALHYVRHTTVFTTHTPVPAGHDQFNKGMVEEILNPYIAANGLDSRVVYELGKSVQAGPSDLFSMTGLAARGSQFINGVSKIHGDVSRKMLNSLYPDLDHSEVPVGHVTNGVHVLSWLAPDWQNLFHEKLGPEWPKRFRDQAYWNQVKTLPDEQVWDVKMGLKRQFIDWLRGYIRTKLSQGGTHPQPHLGAVLGNLSESTLLIAHSRRLAPYKRADLIFLDPDRLHRILNGPQPVMILYAGKAHPSDGMGQDVLKRIFQYSTQPDFLGKILFIENYDLEFARKLIAGVDIWLNTPLRPLEASGTSGMKAGVNGTLNLSVADGWWPEYYNGLNGWMLGTEHDTYHQRLQDQLDAHQIYNLLESEILPEYYRRDERGLPIKWIKRVKDSIATLIPGICAERMIEEYLRSYYDPARKHADELSAKKFGGLKHLEEYKQLLRKQWPMVKFVDAKVKGLDADHVKVGDSVEISVDLDHPGLSVDVLEVDVQLSHLAESGGYDQLKFHSLVPSPAGEYKSTWNLNTKLDSAGHFTLMVKISPRSCEGLSPAEMDMSLVKWL